MSSDRYIKTEAKIVSKRSLFPLQRRTLMSYFHGYLHPVGAPIEVLPGDTIKAKLSAFTRMSTPIVPIMDNIRQEVDAFFVPKRIIFNKTKQFYGEAPSFGIASPVTEPYISPASTIFTITPLANLSSNLKKSESFAAAFGLVYDDSSTTGYLLRVNVLPIRAYLAVFNEFYRDENYQDPYVWNKDASGLVNDLCTFGGSYVYGTSDLPLVNKDRDVVSSLLPFQIKGSPVTLSIGQDTPIYAAGDDSGVPMRFDNVFLKTTNMSDANDQRFIVGAKNSISELSGRIGIDSSDGTFTTGLIQGVGSSNKEVQLFADLRNVTAVNVSDLIYAFSYQDFLARAAHFGTRYKEYIYGMFGTIIADATEDIPEYLGRLKFNINVNQVVQTTGFQSSSSTELGMLGAYSNSGSSGELFNKSFTEPGYIVLVTYCKHQRTYSSGIDRVFLKTELLDYYQPPFANIADVPFGSHSIWLDKPAETSLGFQEPFWDYKGLLDRSYGLMNPKISTLGEIWTLSEKWTTKPTIGAAFMKEDRVNIARVLATGVNGPDYIMDFQLDMVAARVMPVSSRTGLKVM